MRARRRSVAAVVLALAVLLVPVSQAGSGGGHRADGLGGDAAIADAGGHGGTAVLAASLPLGRAAEPQASCSLSSTEIEPGEEVTLDASGSENAVLYRYSKFGDATTDWTESTSTTFVYEEAGTYTPAVEVMNENETTDTASCGELVVSESTPTPTPSPTPTDTPSPTPSPTPTDTPTPTPTPTSTPSAEPVARCTVSETSVEVGEEVTLDASESENADGYQFDRLGTGEFGELYAEPTRTVTYEEPGTYVPQVKAWSTDTETSDTATCGEVSVASATSTPTPTDTPTPSPTPAPTSTPTDSPTPSPTPEPTSTPSATPSSSPSPTPAPSPSPTGSATPSGTPTGTATPSAMPTGTATPSATPTPGAVTAEWWYSPSTPRAGQPVSLVADGPPGAVTYRWDLDDDGRFERTGRLASVTFGQRGRHTVTLKAVGPAGTNRTSSRTIRALPATTGTPSGNASFWFAPNTPEPTETITFLADPGRLRGSFDGFGWDLDADGSIEQRGRLASQSYPEGRHLVDLVFLRQGSPNVTVSRTVVVGDPPLGPTVPSPSLTTPSSTTPSPTPTSSPGFGLAVGLVAVLLGAVALRRRGAS